MSQQTPWSPGIKTDGTLAIDPRTHPAHAKATIVDAAHGLVETIPRRRRVAIVGFASSSRDAAPYDDPTWEVWGLNQLYRYMPRFDRWFEIHAREMFLADQVRDSNYLGWLRSAPVPVYMIDRFDDIAQSVRYPIEALVSKFGRDYFTSTPAYMMALAIAEGFEEIAVYGIDLVVGDEYFYQKPCMEWWIGLAQGRGVTVTLPPQTALCKQLYRYGAQAEPQTFGGLPAVLAGRKAHLAGLREECIQKLNALDGALGEIAHVEHLIEIANKGVALGT